MQKQFTRSPPIDHSLTCSCYYQQYPEHFTWRHEQTTKSISLQLIRSLVHTRNSQGRYSPYLAMVWRFSSDEPCFWDLRSDWDPISCLLVIWLTPSFCKKIGLSLSHFVSEILGPKVGLNFHQNVLFNRFFLAFCIKFLLNFRTNWLPFSLILDLLTPHFNKNLDLIGSNFFVVCRTRLPTNLMRYPPPPWSS